ncbi:MAG: hypothetical protein KAI91_02235 [Candidatus Omnitrophica bacterium]|nr:hypothetical protein [Candidatus Omnitrophota bacterium]
MEPWLCDNINNAKKKGDCYIVEFYSSDVGEILGALSYSADSAESCIEKERYLNLYDKIKEGFVRNKRLRRSIIES